MNPNRQAPTMNDSQELSVEPVRSKLIELLDDVLMHDGFGDIRVEVKILKRRQKEVILHCGKQYRFVVDTTPAQPGKH